MRKQSCIVYHQSGILSLIPVGLFVFFLRIYRILLHKKSEQRNSSHRNWTTTKSKWNPIEVLLAQFQYVWNSSIVEKLSLGSILSWMAVGFSGETLRCFRSCTYMNGLPLRLGFFVFSFANFVNYLLMFQKFKSTAGADVGIPHGPFLLKVFIFLVILQTPVPFIYLFWADSVSVEILVEEPKEICHEQINLIITILYPSIDFMITCIGFYLFSKPLCWKSPLQMKEKQRPSQPQRDCHKNGTQETKDPSNIVRETGEAPVSLLKVTLQRVKSMHVKGRHDEDIADNFSGVKYDRDRQYSQIIKWNLVGVLLGQLSQVLVAIYILANAPGISHEEVVAAGWLSNYSYICGIHFMFRDHLFFYKKLKNKLKKYYLQRDGKRLNSDQLIQVLSPHRVAQVHCSDG